MQRPFGGCGLILLMTACTGDPQEPPGPSPVSAAGSSSVSGGGGAAGSVAGNTSTMSGGMGGSDAQGGMPSAGAANGGSPPETEPKSLADCALSFPYKTEPERGNWMGADSNFSVVLSETTALMTFQDTFVGGSDLASRAGTGFVSNTVAAIGCQDGGYSIEYFWRREGDAQQAVFVDTHPSGDRLWIHRPWLYQGKLFLTATRVGAGGALGFEEHGMTLARVNDPTAPPSEWDIEYFDLTDQRATVGKGMASYGDYVYLFTPHENDVLLARLHHDQLLAPSISEASLEYLAADDSWQPGLDLVGAKRLGLAANTGLTVRYHEASQQWLALFLSTDHWPSGDVVVSSAPALEGPWSQPQKVYDVPEMNPGAAEYDVDNICYGASEHDAFNPDPDARLLFTYTCNSLVFEKQVANLALYVPVVVDVANPLLP